MNLEFLFIQFVNRLLNSSGLFLDCSWINPTTLRMKSTSNNTKATICRKRFGYPYASLSLA